MSEAAPTSNREPLVLLIDDREDQRDFADAIGDRGVRAVFALPDDVDADLLSRATTVVVDQYLDSWPGRSERALPVSLEVPDGLSLVAVLRSHVEGSAHRTGRPQVPVAFALRTGEFDALGAGLPRAARAHLLASQYNLEWVFDKAEQTAPHQSSPSARVAALARATAELPTEWGSGTDDPGLRWLALPDEPWAEDARWQIEQCRPPQHVIAERTAGRAWLRWFLHRILPFPTFLLDRRRVALVLGLEEDSLDDVVDGHGPLTRHLAALRYAGPLDSFLGERWWRAGLSHLITEILDDSDGDLADARAIAAALADFHGTPLVPVAPDRPVLRVGADYTTLPRPITINDAVRLQPDGWPPYADEAWASRSDLDDEESDPELQALVVSSDRWRLQRNLADDTYTSDGVLENEPSEADSH